MEEMFRAYGFLAEHVPHHKIMQSKFNGGPQPGSYRRGLVEDHMATCAASMMMQLYSTHAHAHGADNSGS